MIRGLVISMARCRGSFFDRLQSEWLIVRANSDDHDIIHAIQGPMWKYFAFCFCPNASQFIVIITFSYYYLLYSTSLKNKEKEKESFYFPNSVAHGNQVRIVCSYIVLSV